MWTRQRHAEARACALAYTPPEKVALAEAREHLSEALDEIERLTRRLAALYTSEGITPQQDEESLLALIEAKEGVCRHADR